MANHANTPSKTPQPMSVKVAVAVIHYGGYTPAFLANVNFCRIFEFNRNYPVSVVAGRNNPQPFDRFYHNYLFK